MPQLNAALAELDNIGEQEMAEIRRYTEPPKEIKFTLQAVMVILNKNTEWNEIKKTMTEKNFLKDLRNVVKSDDGSFNVPSEGTIKKLEKYTRQDFFKVETMVKKSVTAAKLCSWVCALENYAKTHREIEPKKAKLADAERRLENCKKKVDETNKNLKECQMNLEEINGSYELTNSKI